ncbi:MAG: SRPBCC family protein [Bdellovibrionales bacterium]|nr:SRPBCC family protein [Bdellovibrionales bacterium]
MLKTMLSALLLIFVVVLGIAASRPDTFQIARSTTIQASPDKIFLLLSDFKNWAQWSPYEKMDPHMKKIFSGAPAGRGAIYEWEGSRMAGAGRTEITQVSEPVQVVIRLDMFRPFRCTNTVLFTLETLDRGTKVTWSMTGPVNLFSKVMNLLIGDRMVGNDFEQGLASLKMVAEKL